MARITINNYKGALGIENTYDIVNAIRNEGTPQLQQYVPLANLDNIAQVGAGIMLSQTVQNEFITALVDRISLVVLRKVTLKNTLAKFKKGMLPMGRKIEEIFVDLVPEQLYNPEGAESTVFKREIPDVKTLFHEVNRQSLYKTTIQDSSLQMAFVSWDTFDNFLTGIVNSMYNSNEVDEYKYMKLLVDNYHAKGLFKTVGIEGATPEQQAKNLVLNARAVATKMTLSTGSRDYNAMGVHTTTPIEDLHILITADINARMDVDVLAKAFNMDKTTFIGNVTVVDDFGNPDILAVAVDREWFMVYDTLQKMETIRNPQGLYWNYNFHAWQVLSASRFNNAVAFVSNVPPEFVPQLTSVVVNPPVGKCKLGGTLQMNEQILYSSNPTNVDAPTPVVTWSLDDSTNETSLTTTIDPTSGLLTVGADETVETLIVKCSVLSDGGESQAETVVGFATILTY